VIDISAKLTSVHEITPQSDYVVVFNSGRCRWGPRFDLSATHCFIDVTWFPFDVQRCSLVFESWLLEDHELNITIVDNDEILKDYLSSDQWSVTCAFVKPLIIYLLKCLVCEWFS